MLNVALGLVVMAAVAAYAGYLLLCCGWFVYGLWSARANWREGLTTAAGTAVAGVALLTLYVGLIWSVGWLTELGF